MVVGCPPEVNDLDASRSGDSLRGSVPVSVQFRGVGCQEHILGLKVRVDELEFDQNKISATGANGNIRLVPNGDGKVILESMARVDNLLLDGNTLSATDANGNVVDYKLRQANPKRQAIVGFKSMYYRTIAAGDSYNDTTMLAEADAGILFHAPDNVINEFPQFPAVQTFDDLKREFIRASNRDLSL